MDWHGLEWVLPLYGIAVIVLPIYGFKVFQRRYKNQTLSRFRAFIYFTVMGITPVILYIAFFLFLVGMEEVINAAIITEGMGRTLFPALGAGLIVWLVSTLAFCAVLLWNSK